VHVFERLEELLRERKGSDTSGAPHNSQGSPTVLHDYVGPQVGCKPEAKAPHDTLRMSFTEGSHRCQLSVESVKDLPLGNVPLALVQLDHHRLAQRSLRPDCARPEARPCQALHLALAWVGA
jgi:hypothetical protein